MQAEISALENNHTQDLVYLPEGKRPIGYKWIFKIKYKSSGKIEKFKARLVAKGYSQQQGIDYQKTFSLLVKMVTVKTVLAFDTSSHWHIHQIDMYNAFLQGYLTDDIYMELPQEFLSQEEHKPGYKPIFRLIKSLYGLKQAPRQWNAKLSDKLLRLNFKQSQYDHPLYIKRSDHGIVMILIYVDDMLVT